MTYQDIDSRIKKDLKGWTRIVRRYQKPSTRKAFIQITNTFLPFLALWVLMYFTYDYSKLLTLGIGVIAGFFMVRIFIIQHDCGHQSFFKKTWLNNLTGVACSVFSSIPFRYWATNHNFHHVHSGKLEVRDIGDIDTLTVEEYRQKGWLGRLGYRAFRHPIVMFIVGPAWYIGVVNRLPLARLEGWRKTLTGLLPNNLLILGLYLLLGFLIGWAKFFFIQLSVIMFFGIIAVWFFYVQHQHEATYKKWSDNWDYLLSAIRGSTYYKLPRLVQWLTGNIGFHHIHHLNSGIPNYNLEKCAKENPVFQRYVTIVGFRESLKCLQHKLWYDAEERMISFREFYRLERQNRFA